jgi:uncharacterized protein YjlB
MNLIEETQTSKNEREKKGRTTEFEDWKRSIYHYHHAHANIFDPFSLVFSGNKMFFLRR